MAREQEALEVKVFRQFMDLLVVPEIQRRQECGAAPRPLGLRKVQVVFSADGEPPVVRLNDEVKAHARVKLKEGVAKKKGEHVRQDEIAIVDLLDLPEDERDHGHFTAILLDGGWHTSFSFIYNRKTAKQMVELGRQFWQAAEGALARKHLRVCIDNLFSAAELAAKASVVCWFPTSGLKSKATHKGIIRQYGKYAKIGNAPREHSSLLAELRRWRSQARYLQGRFRMPRHTAETSMRSVEAMLDAAEKSTQ